MDHGTRPARQARAQRHERQSRVHICFPRSPRLGAWPKSPPCTQPREGGDGAPGQREQRGGGRPFTRREGPLPPLSVPAGSGPGRGRRRGKVRRPEMGLAEELVKGRGVVAMALKPEEPKAACPLRPPRPPLYPSPPPLTQLSRGVTRHCPAQRLLPGIRPHLPAQQAPSVAAGVLGMAGRGPQAPQPMGRGLSIND